MSKVDSPSPPGSPPQAPRLPPRCSIPSADRYAWWLSRAAWRPDRWTSRYRRASCVRSPFRRRPWSWAGRRLGPRCRALLRLRRFLSSDSAAIGTPNSSTIGGAGASIGGSGISAGASIGGSGISAAPPLSSSVSGSAGDPGPEISAAAGATSSVTRSSYSSASAFSSRSYSVVCGP